MLLLIRKKILFYFLYTLNCKLININLEYNIILYPISIAHQINAILRKRIVQL